MKFLVMVVVLMCSVASWGDPIYQVTGNLSINGANMCGASPCNETLIFSFQLGYVFNARDGYVAYWLPGTMSVSSMGPLGTLVAFPIPSPDAWYVGFFNSGGDELDLEFGRTSVLTTDPPIFDYAQIYGCKTATCTQDFPDMLSGKPYGIPDVTVTLVPESMTEGSELPMLGIVGLGILEAMRRRFRRPLSFS